MKKILFSLFLSCLVFLSPKLYASGGITHMFIAMESIALLPDAQLRNLIIDHLDAYLVGSYYPDSGYVKGTHYGEDSHWDPFIFAFADHLQATYTDPVSQNPDLVAFLFGCATHRVADVISHWTFYPEVSARDFHGNYNKAHNHGDTGIDFLLVMEKSLVQPLHWWVPIKDLLAIYKRMGLTQYTATEILLGNNVISIAGLGERIIAPAAYPILKWRMPWTAANYYHWPKGGLMMNERSVADYAIQLWDRLQHRKIRKPMQMDKATQLRNPSEHNLSLQFAQEALESGAVYVPKAFSHDGNVVLETPIILRQEKFNDLLNDLLAKLQDES